MQQLPLTDISDCFSKRDIAKKLNLSLNGTTYKKIDKYIIDYSLNTDHFDSYKSRRKYENVEKTCPICTNTFIVKQGDPKEATTCSYACSNKHFRSGFNSPNLKIGNNYRTTCFLYHQKKCIICGEYKIVEVHHYDENHDNNEPLNLVPMCPTHHQYMHSRYKHEISEQVDKYVFEATARILSE